MANQLAQYYDPNGAVIIFEGQRRFFSRAALDTFYRNLQEASIRSGTSTLPFCGL